MKLIQTNYAGTSKSSFWFEYLEYSFDGWIGDNVDLDIYQGSYSTNSNRGFAPIPVERL